jgi:hypothetical protein
MFYWPRISARTVGTPPGPYLAVHLQSSGRYGCLMDRLSESKFGSRLVEPFLILWDWVLITSVLLQGPTGLGSKRTKHPAQNVP